MLWVITFVLSLIFILIARGFWAALVAFVGALVLAAIMKPRYSWEANWGTAIGVLVIQILGICAVNSIWGEPAYNAVAVILVALSYVI